MICIDFSRPRHGVTKGNSGEDRKNKFSETGRYILSLYLKVKDIYFNIIFSHGKRESKHVILPELTHVRFVVTSSDVIHEK